MHNSLNKLYLDIFTSLTSYKKNKFSSVIFSILIGEDGRNNPFVILTSFIAILSFSEPFTFLKFNFGGNIILPSKDKLFPNLIPHSSANSFGLF